MPFPNDPFVTTGGCNCNAVRYRISVPEFSKRAVFPYHLPGADIGDQRLPKSVVCHCNDCRRTTTSLGACGLVTETATLSLSILPKNIVPDHDSVDDAKRPTYVPALSILGAAGDTATLENMWMSCYPSSPGRYRTFCGRCGTPLFASSEAAALPPDWPNMLNVWTGTVDREHLEKEMFRPENINFVSIAIPWIRDHVKNGAGDAVERPLMFVDRVMKDDFAPDVEVMRSIGMKLDISMWE